MEEVRAGTESMLQPLWRGRSGHSRVAAASSDTHRQPTTEDHNGGTAPPAGRRGEHKRAEILLWPVAHRHGTLSCDMRTRPCC
ncbi:hypothetical protein EYF80_016253 [Liparis tanakae]|uniref:Uncharacterized protein n=1 Tax=Liparis tanakae TaxID=230148 RepID=A0A4Z2I8M7_9TELE|nr:hypothetical protein EYF80_016253 [Liparis tanakae]